MHAQQIAVALIAFNLFRIILTLQGYRYIFDEDDGDDGDDVDDGIEVSQSKSDLAKQ